MLQTATPTRSGSSILEKLGGTKLIGSMAFGLIATLALVVAHYA
ncbi:MAG: hypothetical protein AAFQ83_19365 [Bacteroidota bacterium]